MMMEDDWNVTRIPTSEEHSRHCWHYKTMGDGECDCNGPDVKVEQRNDDVL